VKNTSDVSTEDDVHVIVLGLQPGLLHLSIILQLVHSFTLLQQQGAHIDACSKEDSSDSSGSGSSSSSGTGVDAAAAGSDGSSEGGSSSSSSCGSASNGSTSSSQLRAASGVQQPCEHQQDTQVQHMISLSQQLWQQIGLWPDALPALAAAADHQLPLQALEGFEALAAALYCVSCSLRAILYVVDSSDSPADRPAF
jgi:hypothetical protein